MAVKTVKKTNATNDTFQTEFRGKSINIKAKLSLSDSIQYVDTASSTVVNLSNDSYTPLYEDLVKVNTFLDYYTDIETPDLEELYSNLHEYEKLINSVIRCEDFNTFQYNLLISSVNKEIEFKIQTLIHNQKSSLDELFITINDIVSKMGNNLKLDELMPIIQKLGKLEKFDEKSIIDSILNSKPKTVKAPQDRKKRTTKATTKNTKV